MIIVITISVKIRIMTMRKTLLIRRTVSSTTIANFSDDRKKLRANLNIDSTDYNIIFITSAVIIMLMRVKNNIDNSNNNIKC